MSDMKIQTTLRRERSWLKRRKLLLLLVSVSLFFGVPALLFGLLDLQLSFREPTAAAIVLVLAGASFVFAVVRLVTVLRGLPSTRDIALRVEGECPEMMDSLICASELLEKGEELNALKQALIHKVEQQLQKRDLHAIISRTEIGVGLVCMMLIVGILAMGTAHFLPLGVKARAHMSDLARGKSTAFEVKPGDVELARGSDLVIEARILRGPKQKVVVRMSSAKGVQEYRMTPTEEGTFTFEMYGIDEPFIYEVQTPTLTSQSYAVKLYERPRIEKLSIIVEAPGYTQLPKQQFSDLRDLVVSQGATITLDVKGNMPLTGQLLLKGRENLPFQKKAEPTEMDASFKVASNTEYQIKLIDQAGHEIDAGPPHQIEVIEDLPPLIQITSPDEDSSRQDKEDEVPIMAQLTDDYGLASAKLKVNINGNGWKEIAMYKSDRPGDKEKMTAEIIKLQDIVEYGDVVTYFIEAEDYAEPKPNRARSEIRFLEVRPPKTPPQESEGQKGQDKEKLSVADLIMQLKQLLKESYRHDVIRDPQKQKDHLDELIRRAADLHVTAKKRFTKIEESVKKKGAKLGKFKEYFDGITRNLSRAQDLLEKRLPADSADYQQGALAYFIKIEIELEKNQKKSKGQGKGKKQEQEVSEKNEQKEQQEKLEQIRRAIRKLDRMIDRQQVLSKRIDRVKPDEQGKTESQYLSKKEGQVAEDVRELKQELDTAVPEAYNSISNLNRSNEQLEQAKKKLGQQQSRTAAKHAKQALDFLRRSRKQLDELQQQMSGKQLEDAMAELDRIRKQQEHLKNETSKQASKGKPSSEAGKQLSKAQTKLQDRYQQLLRNLDRVGEQLEESSPQAADELSKAMQKAEQSRIAGSMKRSSNALRYRRMKKAEQYQGKVLKALENLKAGLQKAGKGSKRMSPQEISEMLGKTLKDYQDVKNRKDLSKEERKALADRVKEGLQKLPNKLPNPELKKLGRDAQSIGESGEGMQKAELMLAEASRVLEKELLKAMLRQKIQLGRIHGQEAPDAYRKLVQEYFKSLSETEN